MLETICNIIINLILAIFRIKRFSNSRHYLKDECMISPQITYSTTRIRKIITWNTNGIFIYFNNNKLKKIIKTIHNLDADLICLQECFDNNMKNAIIENLKIQYPYFLTGSLKKRLIIGEDSGLLVLSKLPIQHVKFYNFKSSSGIDGWLSNKGVLYFTVDGVNFANTHTQSEALHYCSIDYPDNPSVSKKQIGEIIENSPFGRNFVLMGDLNNSYACNVMRIPENNTEYTFMDDKMCYDYIVNLYRPELISDVSVIKLKDNPSDHYPVVGYI
jgi:exonuclease III